MGRGNNVVLKLLWIWAMRSEIIKRIKDIEHVNLRTKIFIYFRKLIPVYHLIFITIQIDMKLWWFFLLPLLFCSNSLWVYPCISVQSEYKKKFLKMIILKMLFFASTHLLFKSYVCREDGKCCHGYKWDLALNICIRM